MTEQLVKVNPSARPAIVADPVKPEKRSPGNFRINAEVDGEEVKLSFATKERRDQEFRKLKGMGYNPQAFDVATKATEEPVTVD